MGSKVIVSLLVILMTLCQMGEVATETTIDATTEATAEDTTGATTEAITDATIEATTEDTTDATTEATADATTNHPTTTTETTTTVSGTTTSMPGLTDDMIQEMVEQFKNDLAPNCSASFTSNQLNFLAFIGNNGSGQQSSRRKRSIWNPSKKRQEYRTLSTAQRTDLHTAFNAMKSTMIDGMSEYDIFANMHTFWMAPGAHGGAAFSAWHREFLWRFERALQSHVPGVMIPYWDSSLDQHLPDPSASAIWTPDYLGNNKGFVTTGFAAWWTTPGCCLPFTLERNAWTGPIGQWFLFNDGHVNQVLNAKSFADIYCLHNCNFYWRHVLVHIFVGGHFAYSCCSASDPVFWLHHAYIDCLWEEYRQTTLVKPEFDYPTADDPLNGGPAHFPEETMLPFSPMSNIHGLSDHYTNYYYSCAPRLTSCNCNEDCESALLYCDVNTKRCKAKVRLGGDCTGLSPPFDVCDSTQCTGGKRGGCIANCCICC